MFSARDQVAFQRFRHWINDNVTNYISNLTDANQQANAQELLDEFGFEGSASVQQNLVTPVIVTGYNHMDFPSVLGTTWWQVILIMMLL